jgi:hypothetical protein
MRQSALHLLSVVLTPKSSCFRTGLNCDSFEVVKSNHSPGIHLLLQQVADILKVTTKLSIIQYTSPKWMEQLKVNTTNQQK